MTVDDIIDYFCEARGLTRDTLFGKYKGKTESITRYQLWYYLHYTHGYSAGRISRMFHRNLPTVFRGIRVAKHHIELYKDTKDEYDAFIKKMEDTYSSVPSADDMKANH